MSDDRTEGIESIIGKAAFDDAFAEALKEDPEAALRGIGIEPTDEMLEALGENGLSPGVQQIRPKRARGTTLSIVGNQRIDDESAIPGCHVELWPRLEVEHVDLRHSLQKHVAFESADLPVVLPFEVGAV